MGKKKRKTPAPAGRLKGTPMMQKAAELLRMFKKEVVVHSIQKGFLLPMKMVLMQQLKIQFQVRRTLMMMATTKNSCCSCTPKGGIWWSARLMMSGFRQLFWEALLFLKKRWKGITAGAVMIATAILTRKVAPVISQLCIWMIRTLKTTCQLPKYDFLLSPLLLFILKSQKSTASIICRSLWLCEVILIERRIPLVDITYLLSWSLPPCKTLG
mmetsp:Transcript_39302/g.67918  ORF Transcript_39302/g.67918 Transcript_39302/m.67918 type:complete len:213 (-) Transcript_39302:100-738(-)